MFLRSAERGNRSTLRASCANAFARNRRSRTEVRFAPLLGEFAPRISRSLTLSSQPSASPPRFRTASAVFAVRQNGETTCSLAFGAYPSEYPSSIHLAHAFGHAQTHSLFRSGHLQPQMIKRSRRRLAALGRAHNEPLLNKERLVHVFHRARVFRKRRCKRGKAHGTPRKRVA